MIRMQNIDVRKEKYMTGYPTLERNAGPNALKCVAEIQKNQALSLHIGKDNGKSRKY